MSEFIGGEYPANIRHSFGEVLISETPGGKNKSETDKYLANHPQFLTEVKSSEQDVIEVHTSRGKMLIVGIGAAALIVAGAYGAYKGGRIVYEHLPKEKKEEIQEKKRHLIDSLKSRVDSLIPKGVPFLRRFKKL